MKTVMIAIMTVIWVTTPLSASDHFINFGTNSQNYNERFAFSFGGVVDLSYSRGGVALLYTYLKGDRAGMYVQLAPFLALDRTSSSDTFKYLENQIYGGGVTATVGYGVDIKLRGWGILIGGGLFGSGYASYYPPADSLYWETALGMGGGVHLYFPLGSSSFLINVGIDIHWRPLRLYGSSDDDFVTLEFNSGNTNGSANAGVGFRH